MSTTLGRPAPGPHARRATRVLAAAAGGLLAAGPLAPAAARAQGFGLNEIGTCAIARGAATTSAPCADASSIFWNPGAVSTVPQGTSAYVGGSAIQVTGNFRQDVTAARYDGDVPVEFPPFLGFTVHTRPRLVLGLAAYVPYGLTSQWRDDFPGRFSAQRASLQTIYVQPTAAYELVPGRLSVGAGAVFGYSRLELRQALDLANSPAPATLVAALGLPERSTLQAAGIQPGTEFGRVGVEGDAFGGGFHAGLQAKLTRTLMFGARYLSEVVFRYSNAPAEFTISPRAGETRLAANNLFSTPQNPVPAGTPISALVAAQFAPGGALGPGQTAGTRIAHPAQFQAGLAFSGLPRTTVSADYALVQWSSFKELPVDFTLASGQPNTLTSRTLIENYQNSNSVRVGLEHRFARLLGVAADSAGAGGVALRLGVAVLEGAAPPETVTPLLPDMDRVNVSGGLGIPLGRNAQLDLAYLRVLTRGRRGRTAERPETFTAEEVVRGVNNGFYSLNANVLSASVRANLFR